MALDNTRILEKRDIAEYVTEAAFDYRSLRFQRDPSKLRPVWCPTCRRHYTMLKPRTIGTWAPTVVHVVCGDCGGNGKPSILEAPR